MKIEGNLLLCIAFENFQNFSKDFGRVSFLVLGKVEGWVICCLSF